MKFKYSVIGDNTQENREWLEKLGYEPWFWTEEDNSFSCISTMPDNCEYGAFDEEDFIEECFSNDIDCRNNPDLFKAVTAIREDSNINKYFTDGVNFIKSGYEDWKKYIDDYYSSKGMNPDNFREVTLSDLIAHF